jgi:magnesium-protoporphyrin IX monomethyl ester (oxidative) cyclase
VRFFVLAVFATMYIRDHSRPAFHKALGMDPTDYDFKVFRITSQISQQVFPVKLDLDNPAFHRGLERLFHISERREAAKAEGGVSGLLKNIGYSAAAAATFARLYILPAARNELPDRVRLAPAW